MMRAWWGRRLVVSVRGRWVVEDLVSRCRDMEGWVHERCGEV